MARRANLGVRFARWEALHGAWNRIRGHPRRVHYFARQKLLSRTCLSDAFCSGRGCRGARFRQPIEMVKPGLLVLILASGALLAPLVVPILPPGKLVAYMRAIGLQLPRTETSHTAPLPQIFADQFGWQEMVASVGHVYNHLRPEDKKRAAIFCQNYGEAGAIDFFGPKFGLPPAISGHQNYFLWGPRDWTGEVALVLDTRDDNEREQFASVEDLGQIVSSPWAMPFERRMHIYLCHDLKANVQDIWPQVKKWL